MVPSKDVLVTIDNSHTTGIKQQNNHLENTKFSSNNLVSKNNHKKLIKSPFEVHNTIQHNSKNQTKIQRNTETTTTVSETKESNKIRAVITASKLNSSGSSFQYNKVVNKLESVSEIEENFSTQSNSSKYKNASPLIYVDTND